MRTFSQIKIIISLLILISQSTIAQETLVDWDFFGTNSFGTNPKAASTLHPNCLNEGLKKGYGISNKGTAASNAWGGNGCTSSNSSDAILNGNYFLFDIQAKHGYTLSIDRIDEYNIRRTENGARFGQWQYSTNYGNFINIGSEITFGNTNTAIGNAQAAINLSGIAELQNIQANTRVQFRLVLWGESGSNQSVYFNNTANSPDLSLIGTISENADLYIKTDKQQLNKFTYSISEGGPSDIQSLEIIGDKLQNAALNILAPSQYEISLHPDSSFSSSIQIYPQGITNDSIQQSIYLRLKGGLGISDYNEELVISGAGTSSDLKINLSGNVVSCTHIWKEDFNAIADKTTQTERWTTNFSDMDDSNNLQTIGNSYFGVKDFKLIINDMEGTAECLNGGKLDNEFITEAINIADYQNIIIKYAVLVKGSPEGLFVGSTEVEGDKLTEGIDGNSSCGETDKLLGYYSLDKGISWIKFASLYGGINNTTYTFISDTINCEAKQYIKIKLVGGNTADAEEYHIDNIQISGNRIIHRPAIVCNKHQYQMSCEPKGGIWNTSNNSIASINTDGVLNIHQSGKVEISYTTCNGISNTEILIPYEAIVNTNNPSICYNESALITANSNSSTSIFKWYDSLNSDSTIHTGNNFTTAQLETDTLFYLEVETEGCTHQNRIAVPINVGPKSTTWQGTNDSNWHNPSNWTNGVPCATSSVTIPDVSTGIFYPEMLSTGYADSIRFESRAAVKGLPFLIYNKAFVELSLARDKWYTLCAPLKEMYSGDYYLDGAPITQMRLFDTAEPDNGEYVIGSWSSTFASLSTKLEAEYGFAYLLEHTEWDRTNPSPLKSNNYTAYTLKFPNTNTDGSLKTVLFPYSVFSGKINLSKPTNLSKTANNAYRFAAEDDNNSIPNNIPVTIKPGLNMIANPLLTHLDFNAFQTHNAGKISNKLKVWNGSSFDAFIIGDEGLISSSLNLGTGCIIPPMQAFFVECITTAATDIDFDSANDFVTNNNAALRSSSLPQNRLYIEAESAKGKSSICITQNKNAKNGWDGMDDNKLFTPIEELADIYSLVDGKAVGINQFKDFPYCTPINFKGKTKERIKLNFQAVSSFDPDFEIKLKNTKTGESIDLKELNEYEYEFDPACNNELFLVITEKSSTCAVNIDEIAEMKIWTENEKILIQTDSGEEIQKIEIFDISGHILITEKHLSSNFYCTKNILKGGTVIVKVNTIKQTKTSVLIIK